MLARLARPPPCHSPRIALRLHPPFSSSSLESGRRDHKFFFKRRAETKCKIQLQTNFDIIIIMTKLFGPSLALSAFLSLVSTSAQGQLRSEPLQLEPYFQLELNQKNQEHRRMNHCDHTTDALCRPIPINSPANGDTFLITDDLETDQSGVYIMTANAGCSYLFTFCEAGGMSSSTGGSDAGDYPYIQVRINCDCWLLSTSSDILLLTVSVVYILYSLNRRKPLTFPSLISFLFASREAWLVKKEVEKCIFPTLIKTLLFQSIPFLVTQSATHWRL